MSRRRILACALPLALLLVLLPGLALAQSVNIDLGGQGGGSSTSRVIQLVLLITVLSLAPSILLMVTSFTRIAVVLAMLRQAIGTNTTPPNMVLLSLAMFLTFFVMTPTFERSWNEGVRPLINEQITEGEALERAAKPFHDFMMKNVGERDLSLFVDMAKVPENTEPDALPYSALIPAFMISELKRAFEIGFLLYLPFIIIDMVVASVLMSMGMMMLPPIMLALPFKLIFFVLIDGWYLIAGSLVQSFAP
ncbi:flagellar type III secretion system pore protein FliP [Oleispirillum naphthae]|uniref:flagellar type III secretion system pore protein FliP n=1 Tax=Oleispirillum naphthae TaxID=2838853 RepID=UPI00308265B0